MTGKYSRAFILEFSEGLELIAEPSELTVESQMTVEAIRRKRAEVPAVTN
jgi:hypothetical protein